MYIEGVLARDVGDCTGMSLPAYCTASGKALLAALPLECLHKLFPSEQLVGLIPRSLTNRAQECAVGQRMRLATMFSLFLAYYQ
jgi:DNA-binding IclR family transcriptional regulator